MQVSSMETGKLEHEKSAGSQVARLRKSFLLLFIATLPLLFLPLLMKHYNQLVFTPAAHPLTGSTMHHSKQVGKIPMGPKRLHSHTPKTSTAFGLAMPKSHHGTQSNRPASLSVDSKTGSNRSEQFGYILTFEYIGQQGAGISALISQQCWVESFQLPMLLVEPFIVNSHLGAHPKSGKTTLKFSDYYDMELYDKASIAKGYGPLATWEEFLDHAPRQIILIAMRNGGSSKTANTYVLWERRRGTEECYVQEGTDIWQPPMKLESLQEEYNFCAVKVVYCAYFGGSSYTTTEMQQVIFGSWDPQEVTLVFTLWRGPWFVPNPSLPNPNTCKEVFTKSSLADNLHSSPRIIETAQKYERLYLKSKPSVAVMLRTEHVIDTLKPLLRQPNISVAVEFDHCLQDVLTKANHLRRGGGVFATVDVGKYGSNSWNGYMSQQIPGRIGKDHVLQAAKDTVTKLLDNQMTFEEWENTFSKVTSGVEDRGYIAGLQKALASRADCLVLVGGGHFLRLALREYIHNHPHQSTWCIEVLCATKSRMEQYRETFENGRNRSNGSAHIHFVPW